MYLMLWYFSIMIATQLHYNISADSGVGSWQFTWQVSQVTIDATSADRWVESR